MLKKEAHYNIPLNVTVNGNGNGTVTSNIEGINCPGDCTQSYNVNTEVALTADAVAGSTFAGWSGACTGTGTCFLTMDAAKNVTATFTTFNILQLLNPANEQEYTTCTYSNPPKFQWNTSETYKNIKVQFSLQNNFSTIPVKAKGKAGVNELQIETSLWKTLLLLPGPQGGTIYWRVVGTKANKTKEESNIYSMQIEGPEPVGDSSIAPTSKASLPNVSWKNLCGTKFIAWFGNAFDFTIKGTKKKSYTFEDADPVDNEGVFTKGFRARQWKAIRKLVGDVRGSTIYWYVESWDGVERYSKTAIMNFELED